MTNLLHKPKGWEDPINQMSEEEWKEYFRLREELDVEMSEDEIVSSLKKVNSLLKKDNRHEAKTILAIIPAHPRLAYRWKKTMGLKEVMYLNLSLAKKVYPEEF